ncbi:hypothetical protein MSHOH_2306 [Methanosarcina horonobensis HB-1 = JCM 15518]|uniref:DUF1638 domain-containing protein n=3 Tax=Methanosarcina horonobensis TaxID=418008 RepID=A0A0E3SAN7_9EURY|nr:hypothetical protein MSHOH_2306 [Methanosarcina horonobensis HB-1 = JCM 15518]
MPVLSIIACGMLEDELVHVLSKDCELKQLITVENQDNSGLLHKLKLKNCVPRRAFLDRVPMLLKDEGRPDLKAPAKFLTLFPFFKRMLEKRKLREEKKVTVVVNLLSMGLHANLETLKTEVYKNIREMAPFSDRILIFYGTCGHTFGKMEEDFAELRCPLSFLKDKNGEMIEDCISLALGGNEAYARCMLEFRGMGTIYLTPMWASSWKRLENKAKGRDFNNKYLKNSLYCTAAKIDTGLVNNSEFNANVKEFACKFDMKITDLKGSVEIAEQSYLAARNAVTGK